MSVTVAIDAMGGDRAPGEIVAGRGPGGRASSDVRVLLVGREEVVGPLVPDDALDPSRSCAATEVVEMDDPRHVGPHQEGRVDRASAPNSCVTATPTRMVSAGNTGATMAAALLRIGRIKGVARPGDRGTDPGARAPPADPRRRRRHRRLLAGVAGAVRGAGPRVRPHPPRRRRADGRAALERRGAGQGRRAAQARVRAARRRARASSATSRAATSCTPASTSSSPTASPATSR